MSGKMEEECKTQSNLSAHIMILQAIYDLRRIMRLWFTNPLILCQDTIMILCLIYIQAAAITSTLTGFITIGSRSESYKQEPVAATVF